MKKTWWLVTTILVFQVIPASLDAGWIKKYGGCWTTGLYVGQTMDGGYIVAAEVESWLPLGVWVLKTDEFGDTLWTRYYGRYYNYRRLRDAQVTSDGGYILVGAYGGIWLLKADSSGGTEWEKSLQIGGDYSSGHSIQETSDGGYIVGFKAGENSTDYSGLLKLNNSGDQLWYCTFPQGIESIDVLELRGGGYICIDSYSHLRKVDSVGNLLWTKTYKKENVYSVLETNDNGFLFAGNPLNNEDSALIIQKTDSSGNLLWQTHYNLDCRINCVNTSYGGYIMTGTAFFPYSHEPGYYDSITVWFAKIKPNGDTIKTLTFGEGKNGARGYFVQQTTDGNYILTGSLGGYLGLIKIDGIPGITEQPPASFPTFELLTSVGPQIKLRFADANRLQGDCVAVFDAAGRMVDEIHIPQTGGTITWGEGYSPGVYFIRIEGDASATTHKVVLVR